MASPGTSTAQPPARMLYSQTVRQDHNTSNESINNNKVWRRGTGPRSVFFLFDENIFPPDEFYLAARKAFPGDIGRGMHTRRERGSTVVAEIFFSTDSYCEKAVTEGITVGGRRLLGSRPLPPDSEVLKVALSDVPLHYSMEEIQQNVADSMSKYGCILDMNLFTTSQGGWFKGRGVVYLDVGNTSQNYQDLAHTIPWPSGSESFHATWKSMPVYCRYCHEEGHNISDCPKKRRSVPLCWTCNEPGHIASKCPRDPPAPISKRRKTPLLRQVAPTHDGNLNKPPTHSINSFSPLSIDEPEDDVVDDEDIVIPAKNVEEAQHIADPSNSAAGGSACPINIDLLDSPEHPTYIQSSVSISSIDSYLMEVDSNDTEVAPSPTSSPSSSNTLTSIPIPRDSDSHHWDDTVSSLAKKASLSSPPAERLDVTMATRRSTRIRKSPVRYE